jgi:hypothetical protein
MMQTESSVTHSNVIDFDEWTHLQWFRRVDEAKWPVVLPNEEAFTPDQMNAKKHLWLWGKTTDNAVKWVQQTFAGNSVFIRSRGVSPYIGYHAESVIVFDNCCPTPKEIKVISNIHKHMKKVRRKLQPRIRKGLFIDKAVVMIVCSGSPPLYKKQQTNNLFHVVSV